MRHVAQLDARLLQFGRDLTQEIGGSGAIRLGQRPGLFDLVVHVAEEQTRAAVQGALDALALPGGRPAQPVSGTGQVITATGEDLVALPGDQQREACRCGEEEERCDVEGPSRCEFLDPDARGERSGHRRGRGRGHRRGLERSQLHGAQVGGGQQGRQDERQLSNHHREPDDCAHAGDGDPVEDRDGKYGRNSALGPRQHARVDQNRAGHYDVERHHEVRDRQRQDGGHHGDVADTAEQRELVPPHVPRTGAESIGAFIRTRCSRRPTRTLLGPPSGLDVQVANAREPPTAPVDNGFSAPMAD